MDWVKIVAVTGFKYCWGQCHHEDVQQWLNSINSVQFAGCGSLCVSPVDTRGRHLSHVRHEAFNSYCSHGWGKKILKGSPVASMTTSRSHVPQLRRPIISVLLIRLVQSAATQFSSTSTPPTPPPTPLFFHLPVVLSHTLCLTRSHSATVCAELLW